MKCVHSESADSIRYLSLRFESQAMFNSFKFVKLSPARYLKSDKRFCQSVFPILDNDAFFVISRCYGSHILIPHIQY